MSDVTVAPSGGGAPSAAPSAPAPASHEVQINQNPTNSPNPVGPQAPQAPVGDLEGSKHRPQSRAETVRESLKAAYDRAVNPPSKVQKSAESAKSAEPAKAKSGHNNPPEETPKFNLKKRPDDQEQAPASSAQPRGERGQFAPRTAKDAVGTAAANLRGQAQQPAQQAAQPQQPARQNQTAPPIPKLPDHAPFAQPPVRMGERARRDWAGTPESVRGDIHRIQAEFAKAYQFYKDDHEAYKPIKHYAKMAEEHGTTLVEALDNFVGMEHKLRADPIAGLDVIVNNLGLKDPETGRRLGLRDISYYVLQQSPEQLQQIQNANTQQAAAHQIGALHQEIAGLKETINQWQTTQQFTHTRSAVDTFAATHPRFDELGELINTELKLGFDLDQAYARAALLRPAAHVEQIHTTPAQTRPIDRSISGAPGVAPSDGASRRTQKPSGSTRDAVQNALRRVNGVL